MTTALRWVVDLVCALVLAGLAAVVVLVDLEGWVRVACVVPMVVLVPGWALIGALFPGRPVDDGRSFDDDRSGLTDPRSEKASIDGVERLAFSALASIVLVPLVALGVNFSPMAITATPVLLGLVALTVVLVSLAFVRRARLHSGARYRPAIGSPLTGLFYERTVGGIGGGGDRPTGFNVALAIALLLFASSIGYAAVNPPQSDGFTELSVDMENVTGETQSMYPSQFETGETHPLTLLVANHEHEQRTYDVVVELQRVEGTDNDVVEETTVATRSVTLDEGESSNPTVDVTPSMSGSDLRLVVLLYSGSVPEDPTVENAQRTLELPIDVAGGDAASLGTGPLSSVGS